MTDLQADADTAWAVDLGLDDGDVGDSWMAGTDAVHGADGPAELLSTLAARSQDRHRAAAAESALIRRVVDAARADPTPWVGEDPTRDPAWIDVRGRTVAAVRRDRRNMAERAVVAEIALRLRLSEQTVRARAAEAEILQRRCPNVWRAFAEGNVAEQHAAETARLAASLPDDPASWAEFDTGVVDRALRLASARFVMSARALRERVHAESLETRHRRAAQDSSGRGLSRRGGQWRRGSFPRRHRCPRTPAGPWRPVTPRPVAPPSPSPTNARGCP